MTSEAQRRIQRSKQKERDSGKWLIEHDGPDPAWMKIASSTGRVGQINDLQMDVISIHYAGEVKNIRMSQKLLGFWSKIIGVASKHSKVPLLIIYPSNDGRHPPWHIITEARHLELLVKEREHDDLSTP